MMSIYKLPTAGKKNKNGCLYVFRKGVNIKKYILNKFLHSISDLQAHTRIPVGQLKKKVSKPAESPTF